MEINFKLRNLELFRIDDNKIPNFNRNHIYATFDFDSEWVELEKYALFVSANNNKYIVYLGYGKERECLIPSEVLTGALFSVSVFADDLLVSTQQNVLLYSSGYSLEIDDLDLENDVYMYDIDDEEIHRLNEEYIIPRENKELHKREHLYK